MSSDSAAAAAAAAAAACCFLSKERFTLIFLAGAANCASALILYRHPRRTSQQFHIAGSVVASGRACRRQAQGRTQVLLLLQCLLHQRPGSRCRWPRQPHATHSVPAPCSPAATGGTAVLQQQFTPLSCTVPRYHARVAVLLQQPEPTHVSRKALTIRLSVPGCASGTSRVTLA